MVSNLENDQAVRLARQSLESYLTEKRELTPADGMSPLFYTKRGAFVSIKTMSGELRGCIGTIQPTKENLADEIISNAISAGLKDPRFHPIDIDELTDLVLSVDVISPLEQISDKNKLDPEKYGVVVAKGPRKGVLLPDLDGIDSVEKQLRVAADKAGIIKDNDMDIYRFEVTRFYEREA